MKNHLWKINKILHEHWELLSSCFSTFLPFCSVSCSLHSCHMTSLLVMEPEWPHFPCCLFIEGWTCDMCPDMCARGSIGLSVHLRKGSLEEVKGEDSMDNGVWSFYRVVISGCDM
jgi:hypothetical protein